MRTLSGQAAMEYLMTYSWAILIIAVALAALYMFGIFTPGNYVGSECLLPAGFSCTSIVLASNGIIAVNIEQATLSSINVTAYGCNTNTTVAHMQTPYNPPSNQVNLLIGSNSTFSMQCWAGGSTYSSSIGHVFQGYLIVNYTDTSTGLPHTVVGSLTSHVSLS